jgi:dTDP-4-dehydrorhamnose reductase
MNDQKRDVVIVGDQGMLGQCFPPMLAERSVTCAGFDVPAIDITNLDSVRDVLLPIEPRVVINCAAYTDVDGAETDEAAATKINGDGVANLADVCRHLRATLVHYSTDYVFAGDATEPYAVDEPHSPINAYGRSKAVGRASPHGLRAARTCSSARVGSTPPTATTSSAPSRSSAQSATNCRSSPISAVDPPRPPCSPTSRSA